jgi:hypothetical protein
MAGVGSDGTLAAAGAAAFDDGDVAVNVGSLHGARNVGLRCQLGHQGFDLPAATTTGPGQDGLVVLRRQVAAQQAHGGEAHLARREEVEDHREAPAGAGDLDAVAGRVFR